MLVFSIRRTIAFGCLALGLAIGIADSADAQRKVRWKMHSSFGSNLAMLGSGGKRISDSLTSMSGGSFELKFFEPGALLPGLQYFDAVSQGSVESGWGASGYHVNKVPALAIFSSVPFGPRVGEYLAWMRFGGGNELNDEIYQRFGVRGFVCGVLPPEASGWFRNEIKSVEDLKGLKMRFYGLGAKVFEKFGVSTQLLAGGDIYPALELGTIDATEFSMPVIDESIGFYQIAKHYYFPGWHQQTTLLELLVNRAKYDDLSDQHKEMIAVACGDNVAYMITEGEAIQFGAMQRLSEKGVNLHTWPQEILDKYRAAWEQVAQEQAANDPDFKKAYESYSKFRADYAIWRDMGYLR